MGKINQGILGGFSGKVGTVIGGSWKGISYMRSKAQSIRNPRTDGQMSQRSKFALVLRFLQPITNFIRIGYKFYANKQTAFNAAMSYNLANAITGTYPDYEIVPANVLVSRGSLTTPSNAQANIVSAAINITWNDNSGVGTAKQTDKALAVAINLDNNEAIYETAGAARMDGLQILSVPADWTGDSVEVFLGFISEDGKEVSNSVYLGSVVIA